MHELVSPPCLNSLPGKSDVLPYIRVTVQLENYMIWILKEIRSEYRFCVSSTKETTSVTDSLDESF